MTPPYQQPGGNIAFWTVFVLFLLGEYATRLRSRFNERGTPTERWSLVVVVACVAVAMLGAFRVASWNATAIGAARMPLFALGLVLMAGGLILRQWAIIVLGRFFTVDVRVHSQQPVVERGPYRWVRHPAYSGLILVFIGLGLALSSWASLIVLAILPTAGLLLRIRSEERALLAGLGEPYRRYAATRRRLFPGVW